MRVLGQLHAKIVNLAIQLFRLEAERITKMKLGYDVVECLRV